MTSRESLTKRPTAWTRTAAGLTTGDCCSLRYWNTLVSQGDAGNFVEDHWTKWGCEGIRMKNWIFLYLTIPFPVSVLRLLWRTSWPLSRSTRALTRRGRTCCGCTSHTRETWTLSRCGWCASPRMMSPGSEASSRTPSRTATWRLS